MSVHTVYNTTDWQAYAESLRSLDIPCEVTTVGKTGKTLRTGSNLNLGFHSENDLIFKRDPVDQQPVLVITPPSIHPSIEINSQLVIFEESPDILRLNVFSHPHAQSSRDQLVNNLSLTPQSLAGTVKEVLKENASSIAKIAGLLGEKAFTPLEQNLRYTFSKPIPTSHTPPTSADVEVVLVHIGERSDINSFTLALDEQGDIRTVRTGHVSCHASPFHVATRLSRFLQSEPSVRTGLLEAANQTPFSIRVR